MDHEHTPKHVVIVGGGFAGIACARELARHTNVRITLLDKHNYHQFQPLLYHVATSQLAPGDVAYSLRKVFYNSTNVDVKLAEVASVDPTAKAAATTTGEVYRGDYLVLAVGSQANFFKTPGADRHTLPMYSLDDAVRLRSRILQVFEDACRNPKLLDEGALNFVIVGAGATGVETAGALAELIQGTMAAEYPDLAVSSARIHLVDHGHTVLAPFSDKAHDYAEKVLQQAGVQLRLKTGVKEVGPGHALLSDDTMIKTRVVVWAGGLMAAPLAGSTGLPQGHGGRIDVQPDLTVTGFPGVYVLGDIANTPDSAGGTLPQLGSVAQQVGQWAARNIVADIAGQPRTAFQYRDKGIMAMITRRAAVVEIGEKRHELHGWLAAAAWRGVHVSLLSGVRNKVDAFVKWTWSHFSEDRGPQLLDRTEASRIDWDDDNAPGDQVRTPSSLAVGEKATAGQLPRGEKAAVAIPLAVADTARRSTDPPSPMRCASAITCSNACAKWPCAISLPCRIDSNLSGQVGNATYQMSEVVWAKDNPMRSREPGPMPWWVMVLSALAIGLIAGFWRSWGWICGARSWWCCRRARPGWGKYATGLRHEPRARRSSRPERAAPRAELLSACRTEAHKNRVDTFLSVPVRCRVP
jgi:NADH:ubiquinone reductase (H+-translocating)